jgi:predicted SAM-dependent methyltransferase
MTRSLALPGGALLVRRMNWGCGPMASEGWLNSDRIAAAGVDVCCDIRDGLPLRDACLDYVTSVHALQDLPYLDVLPALRELARVLRPGGVLRLVLPDLERALHAFMRGDGAYFHVPDEHAATVGGKLVAQIIWYGSVRTPFTFDCVAELLAKAGFGAIARCSHGRTASGWPEIAALDNRERESMQVEAAKP